MSAAQLTSSAPSVAIRELVNVPHLGPIFKGYDVSSGFVSLPGHQNSSECAMRCEIAAIYLTWHPVALRATGAQSTTTRGLWIKHSFLSTSFGSHATGLCGWESEYCALFFAWRNPRGWPAGAFWEDCCTDLLANVDILLNETYKYAFLN